MDLSALLGKGLNLQRLTGNGSAFVHAGGTLIKKRLPPGEMLKVDTGCILGYSRGVNYNIQFVGGFKNALFGGEGRFLATLEGPGTAYLQSLPFSRLANRIVAAARFGASKGESRGIGGESLGGFWAEIGRPLGSSPPTDPAPSRSGWRFA